jgi:hypothetical protein
VEIIARNGAAATLVSGVSPGQYRLQVDHDDTAHRCTAWVDHIEGAYGFGEVGSATSTGSGHTAAGEFWTTGAHGGADPAVVWLDNIHAGMLLNPDPGTGQSSGSQLVDAIQQLQGMPLGYRNGPFLKSPRCLIDDSGAAPPKQAVEEKRTRRALKIERARRAKEAKRARKRAKRARLRERMAAKGRPFAEVLPEPAELESTFIGSSEDCK